MNRRIARVFLTLIALTAAALAEGDVQQRALASVERLREAYRSGDEEEQAAAIAEASALPDEELIRLVAKGIGSKSLAVREAAIRALGATPHAEALKQLHFAYNAYPRLRENEDLFALLLKSIGRHGDPSSVRILLDKPLDGLTAAGGTARLMGLSNIRTKECVDQLIAASKKYGASGARGVVSDLMTQFRMPFRVAMTVLTGEDIGMAKADWQQWWMKNEKTFTMAPERPAVPPEVSGFWEGYWGIPYAKDGAAPAPVPGGAPFQPVKDPSKEQIAAALAGLKAAYEGKNEDAICVAIEQAAVIDTREVVAEIARGLRPGVYRSARIASVRALGWMPSADALRQLHRLYHRETDLYRDEDVFAELLKAVGRHGDKSSLTVLSSDPFKNLTLAAGRARIYGLGRIRSTQSVDTLMQGMLLGGNSRTRGRTVAQPRFMDVMRVALAVLTGQDFGESKESWQAWWRENKKTFSVDDKRPDIAAELQGMWEGYWGEPY